MYCQYSKDYDDFNKFLQLSQCSILDFEFGDAGIAHIYKNKYKFWEFQWVC